MKKIFSIAIVFAVFLIIPISGFAMETGNGITVYDQQNPIAGSATGNGQDSDSGGVPVASTMTGNGYTVSQIPPSSNASSSQNNPPALSAGNSGGISGGGNLAVANTGTLANSPDLNSLQGVIPKNGGQAGSIYINSLTVNNAGNSVAPANLFDVSSNTTAKTSSTTILYILAAFAGGLVLGAIMLELFELIVIKIIGARKSSKE